MNSISLNVFKQLWLTDLKIFRKNFFSQLIDLYIWVFCVLTVFSYVMQAFGLISTFGIFQLGGVVATIGLFEAYGNVAGLVSDFEGDKTITYQLILPIPSWMVFLRYVCYYVTTYSIITLSIIPFAKILLWNQLELSQISFIKFLLILIVSNIFNGVLTLWIASRIPNMLKIRKAWTRFVFPLWYLGCYQFSWYVLNKTIPILSYFNLLNPIVYSMEGMRSAFLNPNDFLPFPLSVFVLLLSSGLLGWHGYKKLKRRLDFV